MNESLTHIITSLPKHCISPDGTIRSDLKKPAPLSLRESMALTSMEYDVEPVSSKQVEQDMK